MEIQGKLGNYKYTDLTGSSAKKDKIKELLKNITEGELAEITGHLIESENSLGRSVVVAVDAPEGKNIKQVDHRTI